MEDLCDAVLYQAQHIEELKGKTFNIGGGVQNSLSLLELTTLCQNISGQRLDIGSTPETRPGDVPWYVSNHERFSAHTGWRPTRSIEVILRDVHAWIVKYRKELESILS